MDRFTAILVDDERLARKELRSMLAEHEIIDIVGEAETARANLQAIFQVFDLTNRANFGSNFVNTCAWQALGHRAISLHPAASPCRTVCPQSLELGLRFKI